MKRRTTQTPTPDCNRLTYRNDARQRPPHVFKLGSRWALRVRAAFVLGQQTLQRLGGASRKDLLEHLPQRTASGREHVGRAGVNLTLKDTGEEQTAIRDKTRHSHNPCISMLFFFSLTFVRYHVRDIPY
jgi:hypothetical protein